LRCPCADRHSHRHDHRRGERVAARSPARAGASLTLFGGPGGTYRTTTDSAGRYTITRVQSGSYALHVTASGCFLSSTRPVIQDGQTTVHNVRLNCT